MRVLKVLGIETSCDETAAAVVTGDGFVLSDVVKSQIAIHALYGGVVPEIASRDHARTIVPADAGADFAQLLLTLAPTIPTAISTSHALASTL